MCVCVCLSLSLSLSLMFMFTPSHVSYSIFSPTLLLQSGPSGFNAITRTCSLFMDMLVSDTEDGEATESKAAGSSSSTAGIAEAPAPVFAPWSDVAATMQGGSSVAGAGQKKTKKTNDAAPRGHRRSLQSAGSSRIPVMATARKVGGRTIPVAATPAVVARNDTSKMLIATASRVMGGGRGTFTTTVGQSRRADDIAASQQPLQDILATAPTARAPVEVAAATPDPCGGPPCVCGWDEKQQQRVKESSSSSSSSSSSLSSSSSSSFSSVGRQ